MAYEVIYERDIPSEIYESPVKKMNDKFPEFFISYMLGYNFYKTKYSIFSFCTYFDRMKCVECKAKYEELSKIVAKRLNVPLIVRD